MKKKFLTGCIIAISIACNLKKPAPSTEERIHEAVKSYTIKNLNDPDSFQDVGIENIKNDTTRYVFKYTYRAKNGFGGIVTNSECYSIDTAFKEINCCFAHCD